MIYDSSVNEVAQDITKQITPPTPEPEAADLPAGAGGGTALPPPIPTIHFNNPATAPQIDQSGNLLSGLAQQRFAQNLIQNNLAVPQQGTLAQTAEVYNEANLPYHPLLAYNPTPLTVQFAQGLNKITQAANAPGIYGQKAIEAIPVTPYGTSLGSEINRLPGPGPTIGHLVTGAVPYAAADIATGGAATPAFAGLAGLNTANVAAQANAGLISNKQALTQAALNVLPIVLPELARMGIRSAPAIREYLSSPEGQALVERLQSERGAIGTPPEEPGAGAPEPGNVGPEGAPRPVGDNLPAPPDSTAAVQEPVSDAIMPPENQELIAALKNIVPPKGSREAQLKVGRARQFSSRNAAIEQALSQGRSMQEALSAGTTGMSGRILESKNLVDQFAPEKVDSYYQQVRAAETDARITSGEAIAAKNGLDLLFNGARQDGNSAALMPHEVKAIGRVLGPEVESALPKTPQQMTLFQKALAPVQLSRSLLTAFDDSFLGRQGGKFILSDTKAWWDARLKGWQTMFSRDPQRFYETNMEQLRQMPNYMRAQNADRPLGIMTLGGGENPAEEFLSPLTKKIPLLNRSEAMFVVEGNTLRQGALEKEVAIWKAAHNGAEPPDDVFQNYIDNINHASLWGDIGMLGSHTSTLGQTFFSIRAKAALVQYLGDVVNAYRPGTDPLVRIAVTKRLASFLATNLVTLGVMDWIGHVTGAGSVNVNPLSTNFGQAKFGPQKFDVWQGYGPIVRLFIQAAAGARQPEDYNVAVGANRAKLLGNYVRNQLSPYASVGADILVGGGADQGGNRINSVAYWKNKLPPLAIQDTMDSINAFGLLGIPGAIAAFHGIGTQTYQPSNPQAAARANLKAIMPSQNLTDTQKQQLSHFSGKTLDEMRANFEDKYTTYYTTHDVRGNQLAQPVSATEAKRAASQAFSNYSAVKEVQAQMTKSEHQWAHDNPAALVQAVEVGAIVPDTYEKAVVAWARTHPMPTAQ